MENKINSFEINLKINAKSIVLFFVLTKFGYCFFRRKPIPLGRFTTLFLLSWMSKAMVLLKEEYNISLFNYVPENYYSLLENVYSFMNILNTNIPSISTFFFIGCILKFWYCDKISVFQDTPDSKMGSDSTKSSSDWATEYLKQRKVNEIPPVFPNGWIPLLQSTELERGEKAPVFALGESYALFRGYNGKAYIMYAYCPHLGANLSVGGRVMGNCIECPFHLWQFDGETGNCAAIPYTEKMPPGIKVKTWECLEVNGFIYVWHHAEGKPPTWKIPQVPELNTGWTYKGEVETFAYCHIQDIVENSIMKENDEIDTINDSPTKVTWNSSSNEEDFYISSTNYETSYKFFGKCIISTKPKMIQYGPATSVTRFKFGIMDMIMVQALIPEKPLQIKIIQQFYTKSSFPQMIMNMMIAFIYKSLSKKNIAWNNKATYLKMPLEINEDNNITKFRYWYAQFYSDNSPTYKSIQEKTLEW